jgi:hypothetical protein
MAYSSEELEVIWIVELTCGSISVICCLLISLSYAFFSSLRGYEFRLVLYITLSDMIASIMYMIPSSPNEGICSFQGVILSFAENLRLAFYLQMSINIHSTLKACEDKIKKYEKFCLIVIFITSSIFAGLPLITSSYGKADGICWIRVDNDHYLPGTLLRFGVSYIPLWMVICYNYWVYYLMMKNIKNLRRSSVFRKSFSGSAIRKLWLYPAILTICWLPSSINKIIEIFDPEFEFLFLRCLSLGLLLGIGFFNGLAYGFTPEVKDALLRSFYGKDKDTVCESSLENLNSTQLNRI